MTCRTSRGVTAGGWETVLLENQHLAVTVLPEKGGDVLSLGDRARGAQLLYHTPWGLGGKAGGIQPNTSDSLVAWHDQYEGGWQELFPVAGGPCRYGGVEMAYHGEASTLPWQEVRLEESAAGVSLQLRVRLRRSPFSITRTLSLREGEPVLRVRSEVRSETDEDMEVMWGQHLAWGAPLLAPESVLDTAGGDLECDTNELAAHPRVALGARGPWPSLEGRSGAAVEINRPPAAGVRAADLSYLKLREGWYALRNPSAGLGVAVSFPLEVYRYLWLWQDFNGSAGWPFYGDAYVWGVEPCSSIPSSGIEAAAERGTTLTIPGRASLAVDVNLALIDGARQVGSVSSRGEVLY